MCVDDCPSPFISNSDSFCVCPEGKTGNNCEISECLNYIYNQDVQPSSAMSSCLQQKEQWSTVIQAEYSTRGPLTPVMRATH